MKLFETAAFFSLPKMGEEIYETERTYMVWIGLLVELVAVLILLIPSVKEFTGLTPIEFLVAVVIHAVCNVLPYITMRRFHTWKFYGLYTALLNFSLCCMLILFSGNPRSFFGMFFILYAGIAGFAFGFNVFIIALSAVLPIIVGIIFMLTHRLFPVETVWFDLAMLAILSTLFSFYTGNLSDKYYRTLSKKIFLENKLLLDRLRDRVSKDIYTEVSSNLIQLLSLIEKGKKLPLQKPIEAYAQLETIEHYVKRGIDDVRDTTRFIVPENQSVHYFITFIRTYVFDCFAGTGTDIFFTEPPVSMQEDTLNPAAIAHLYRIVQEICQNIRKHSKATQVHVAFSLSETEFSIVVRDNGIGFDPDADTHGFGIRNMKKRIRDIQGEMTIRSEIEGGAEVHILLPVDGVTFNASLETDETA